MFLNLLFKESDRSEIEIHRNMPIIAVGRCDGELSRYEYKSIALIMTEFVIINRYKMRRI